MPELPSVDRRLFLGAAGTGLAAFGVVGMATPAHAALPSTPFALGIASGDVTPSRVILWTRLAPKPLEPGSNFGMGSRTEMTVRWRLARTKADLGSDATSVAHGSVSAKRGNGFAVHIPVGRLAAGRGYFYRFWAGGYASPIGSTRTANAPGDTSPVRFAVINCQNIAGTDGEMFFNGMRELVKRNDIDFVVFLGDYIYEFGRAAHVPPRAVTSLAEYRTRYGQYKTRGSLLELHRKFPVYVMPDDHEFFNDYKGGDLSGSQIGRYNRALQAFWEHMPIAEARPGAVGSDTPNHLRLWQPIQWGSVLQMFLTDTRQYRGPSLLGSTQANRLLSWLDNTTATWTTIATPTPMWYGPRSGWNAYRPIRADVTQRLQRRKNATPARFNPVVLSGDIHCGMVTHVRRWVDHSSAKVATEFLNAPMTSKSSSEYSPNGEIVRAYNHLNGFMVCTASRSNWTTRYFLGNETSRPNGSITGHRAWELRAGAPVGSVHPL